MKEHMKYALLLILTLLTGCSVLNDYGIGGPPRLACTSGGAAIDDRIVGSDDMHVSFVRRFVDGDPLCAPQDVRKSAAAQAERDQAVRARSPSEGRMDR
jgi:hypothetical protein